MPIKLKVITVFFAGVFLLLVLKLFIWQVVTGGNLAKEAKNQYRSGKVISAPRGNIYAADGSILAGRKEAWLLYASVPDFKEGPPEIAKKISPILEADYEILKDTLAVKGAVWIPVTHKISSEVKNNIEALDIAGLGFEPEEDRAYPEASVAAQLLGFVGKNAEGEDTGYFGLEGYYNLPLSGRRGYSSTDKDAKGNPILLGDFQEVSALGGVDLMTNIDKTVQLILEKRLKEGIEKYGAKGGSSMVADPTTGAILAMASYPSFDPAQYREYNDSLFKNPAISDTFEPGSVFKVVVMSAALDAGAVEPETICDICTGPFRVDKYSIATWNNKYHPDSTMTEVIVNSDNVGMIFVGQKLGADKLYDYLKKFGFGDSTGIDLQGEAVPALRPKSSWNIVDLATASFGQGVAITGAQLIRAVSAIANGGKLPRLEVVKGKPKLEQIISPQTAAKMTAMMVEAAKNGEAKWTNTRGFSVAGKTGTAQIPIAGHYDTQNTMASFIGFSPANNPKFIMLITLNTPQSSPWASETAAPLWYSIAKDLFPYFNIQPEN